MNTAMRPPVRFGVALLRNKSAWSTVGTRDGARGWQQEGRGTASMRHGHFQSGELLRAVPQGLAGQWGPERGAGPLLEPLSGLGSQMLSWGEVEGGEKRRWWGWKGQKQIWGFLHPPHLIHPHSHGFSS